MRERDNTAKLTCLPARARRVNILFIGGAYRIFRSEWEDIIIEWEDITQQTQYDMAEIRATYIWKPKLQVLWNNPFLKPLSTDSYVINAGRKWYQKAE